MRRKLIIDPKEKIQVKVSKKNVVIGSLNWFRPWKLPQRVAHKKTILDLAPIPNLFLHKMANNEYIFLKYRCNISIKYHVCHKNS